MKALVTGGAGFIGSHLVERLLSEGHEVVCLDNFDPYYDPRVKQGNIAPFLSDEKFSLVEGSLLDRGLLSRVLRDTDYVFHEAAQAGVKISVDDPMKSHIANATGTLSLLQASAEAGVRKFINASSSSVYGKVHYLPFDEDHPTLPISPYGVTKLAAEHYCRVFSDLYDLDTISLRYFTVYGPRMRPDLAISIFTIQALAGEPLRILGDGTKARDFTYIDDVVEANMLAIKQGSGAFNIGGGHHISIRDLAGAIISCTGSSSRIEYAPPVKGDAEFTSADSSRAARELGWRPRVLLEEGLARYAGWMRERSAGER